MEKQDRVVQMTPEAFESLMELSSSSRKIMRFFLREMDSRGVVKLSQNHVASAVGLSSRGAYDALADLKKRGFIAQAAYGKIAVRMRVLSWSSRAESYGMQADRLFRDLARSYAGETARRSAVARKAFGHPDILEFNQQEKDFLLGADDEPVNFEDVLPVPPEDGNDNE